VANVLGVLGVAVFVACVIAFAAGVTWLVVKLSPAPGSRKKKPTPPEPTPET
jgi:hypothetical protein